MVSVPCCVCIVLGHWISDAITLECRILSPKLEISCSHSHTPVRVSMKKSKERFRMFGANDGARAFSSSFFFFLLWSDRSCGRRAGAARFSELEGHRQQPDRHRLTLGLAFLLFIHSTCAREGGADLSAVGQQRDPLAPPAGRHRRFHFSDIPVRGERWRSGLWSDRSCGRRAGAARFSELGGHRQQPDRHRLTLGASK